MRCSNLPGIRHESGFGQGGTGQLPVDVSDEAREQLAEASAPPIRPVAVGKGVRAATTGGETVQYRHEKTF